MQAVDWQPGLDYGTGYDNVRGDAKQPAVVGAHRPIEGAAGQQGDFAFVNINSESDFDQATDIDVKIGGGFGLFSGSAKFKFKERCKVSSQATFCVVRVSALNAYEGLVEPKLAPDAWDLLNTGNSKRFRERFGDLFVSGLFIGVEFYGVVRIEAMRVERQKEIASSVEASYGMFASGEANVSFKESMSSAEHKIEIFVYQKGGSIEICKGIPDLFRLATNALNEGRGGRGYPFAVTLDPYNELKLPNDDASFVQIEAARRNLARLSDHMRALQRMQNDIDFALRNQAWFKDLDIPTLNTVNDQISAELNRIVEQADICSRDFEACKDYSPDYPQMPALVRLEGAPPAPPPRQTPPVEQAGGLGRWKKAILVDRIRSTQIHRIQRVGG
ncbi:hypothetical protein [Oleisolibacter albus]|uniref:hypothetical protein n=1 Tax=Oleisolibacter albus TaxID=2171757 RepID=UPI000DF17F02|nr:hypothetical protein [Oleisolibacter albus]